ncbi:MAG: HEAT repeat domain-containing protein [Verrucomicrobia bacterium]|nr:HEAT repeat domain-containing protein [Verrucomicrobiota bacterium]
MEIEGPQQPNPTQIAAAKRAKRLLVLVVSLFLAVNGAILYRVLHQPELNYEGKTVTQWLATIRGTEPDPQVVNAFGSDAWPSLIKALGQKDSAFKNACFQFLDKLASATPLKLQKIRPLDAETLRLRSRFWLMQLGPDAKESVPELIKWVREEKDPEIRAAGISVLGFVGLESPEALSALIEVLSDPVTAMMKDFILDDSPAIAVGRFGTRAEPAVVLLVELIRKRKPLGPRNEVVALGMIGREAKEAVPTLVELLGEQALRNNALNALAEIGSVAAEAVPALVQCLKDSQPQTWPPILEILMKTGPPASEALPALMEVESGQTGVLRVLATVATARIRNQPEHAVPALIEALQQEGGFSSEPAWTVRIPTWRSPVPIPVRLGPKETAAWLLAELGPVAKGALPVLAKIVSEKDSRLQTLAARAIWKISQDQAAALPILNQALKQKDELTFHTALKTCEEMGTKARPAAVSLAGFVADKKNPWSDRREVLEVLRKIDPESAAGLSLR